MLDSYFLNLHWKLHTLQGVVAYFAGDIVYYIEVVVYFKIMLFWRLNRNRGYSSFCPVVLVRLLCYFFQEWLTVVLKKMTPWMIICDFNSLFSLRGEARSGGLLAIRPH